MFTSRNQQTMTGQQTGAYDVLTATSANVGTLVATNAIVTCNLSAVAFSGYCITDSHTTTNSMRAASATAVSTLNANMASYLPLSGGNVSGNVNVGGTLYASNVNAIAGYTSTYAYETHSSNLVINNSGTGPALVVTQSQTGPLGAQPVAQFFNGAGTAALVIDNNGNVGVNKPTAGYELDVSGVVCATSFVGDGTGLTGVSSVTVSDSLTSTSSTQAASSKAVKDVYDTAVGRMPRGGGTFSGQVFSADGLILLSNTGKTNSNRLAFANDATYGQFTIIQRDSSTANYLSLGHLEEPDITINGVTGNVGIGKTNPTSSLDVSGDVNVSGTITAGNVAFKIYTISGTLPAASGTALNVAFPSGVTSQNIVALTGVCQNNTGTTKDWLPFSDPGWAVSFYSSDTLSKLVLYVPAGSNSGSRPFKAILMTN